MDEKVREVKESQFSNAKDFSNKFTLLKNEISLSLLDKDTINFIKGIKREWNHLLSRSKTYDDKVNELQKQQTTLMTSIRSYKAPSKTRQSGESPLDSKQTPAVILEQ